MHSLPLMLGQAALAALISLCATPAVRRLAIRFHFLDYPEARKLHGKPTPLLGGVAVYSGSLLPLVVFLDSITALEPGALGKIVTVFGVAGGLLTVGILDDRGLLHPQLKLLLAMPLAASLLAMGGFRLSLWSPSGHPDHGFPLLVNVLLTVIAATALTAAFSIFDHMDGLCCGIGAIAGLFFFLLAVVQGQFWPGILAGALTGANLGFLYWNFNPARIFIGDGGAMFVGIMLAVLAFELADSLPATSWMAPILIVGVPLFDAVLVTISRIRRRLNPFTSPGTDHTAHRLTYLTRSQKGAVVILYLISALLGTLALLIALYPRANYAILIALIGLAGAAVAVLERMPFEAQDRLDAPSRSEA